MPASTVQLTFMPAGKLSVTLSPVPVPAPPLLSVIVKPICETALTLAASAVLVIESAAGGGVGVGVADGVGVGVGVGVPLLVHCEKAKLPTLVSQAALSVAW